MPKRLINADTLRRNISMYYVHTLKVKEAIEEIDKQPSVDAVEVVRCKDCKNKFMKYGIWECIYGSLIVPEGFCNYGERRTDE